jgi:myo-inositol-1-phosphate synthase
LNDKWSLESADNCDKFEKASALNFVSQINQTKAQHVIYLSGIVNDTLSKHLSSEKKVEEILNTGTYAMTTLRAGIRIWKCL